MYCIVINYEIKLDGRGGVGQKRGGGGGGGGGGEDRDEFCFDHCFLYLLEQLINLVRHLTFTSMKID